MNKQFRFTKQKRIIYEAVTSRCDHPSAEDIYNAIHIKYPSISKSTVYRNLDVLSEEGLIRRIKTPTFDRFDLTLNEHSHIVCKICHKMLDVNFIPSNNIDKLVSEETGFLIDSHQMIFEGICPSCLKKIKERKTK